MTSEGAGNETVYKWNNGRRCDVAGKEKIGISSFFKEGRKECVRRPVAVKLARRARGRANMAGKAAILSRRTAVRKPPRYTCPSPPKFNSPDLKEIAAPQPATI